MSQSLLIEFLSEEMPSDEQASGAEQLAKNIKEALQANRIACGEHTCFSTPRRIAVLFADVAEESEATHEEIKGPKKSAPEQAIDGFLKKYNLSAKDCEVRDHKGEDTYFYIDKKPSQKTDTLLETITCKSLQDQSWKNSMRFANEDFTWIRPLRNILVMFGDKVILGKLDLGGDTLKFSDSTIGHSRLHPKPVKLKTADEYEKVLEQKSVIAHAEKRKQMIADELTKLKLDWKGGEKLLEEVTGLVEYPHFATGNIDKEFLKLPAEVLATAMIKHQKYFPLFKGEKPEPQFAFVANMPAIEKVIEGNQRVVRARLRDSAFLLEEDKKIPLEDRIEDLKNINYFKDKDDIEKDLGTMYDKTQRLKKLARDEKILRFFGLNKEEAEKAAELLKADLTTEMVSEFPELQGIMGSEYAKLEGYDNKTIQAIRNHYKTDDKNSLSKFMSLIDKADHLVGFWFNDKKPTGSKDPFALRRAALGIVKIIADDNREKHCENVKLAKFKIDVLFEKVVEAYGYSNDNEKLHSLVLFCCDRYKVLLAEQGVAYDILDTVFDNEPYMYYRIFELGQKVEALQSFLEKPKASDAVVAIKRIINILKAENELDTDYEPPEKGKEDAENELLKAYQDTFSSRTMNPAENLERFEGLVKPINNFFDNVMVNVDDTTDDKKIRQNRLNLLKAIFSESTFNGDFSKLVDR